jgi:hypothetical protein
LAHRIYAGAAARLHALALDDHMPIRVSAHPVFSRSAKLLQTLHGGSHHYARRDNTLHLPGNCSIFGPALVTKKGDQLVVEVRAAAPRLHRLHRLPCNRLPCTGCPAPAQLQPMPIAHCIEWMTQASFRAAAQVLPGGQLGCSQLGMQLQNIEEVLGDAEGRLACILSAEHVEVGQRCCD